MSRIGKSPVSIPSGVEATISQTTLTTKGPKGTLSFEIPEQITVAIEDEKIFVKPRSNSKAARQKWGMSRTMIANCVKGVRDGFRKELHITGVGYRAQMDKNVLKLSLGLSHDVSIVPPEGIAISTPATTEIIVEGIDSQKVGQVAANIRKWRTPEPFKGKGIRYADEFVYRKAGKKK
ncbi:MAG: 50S ribosomal protein L6 [Rhodobacteraceae bacterium]|nr:50S ribosomal protein L6 [Paracoccaceae bacterium]